MPSSRHRSKRSDSSASSSASSSDVSKRKHASQLKLVKIKGGEHRHRDRRKSNKLLKAFSTRDLFNSSSSSSSSSDDKNHKRRSKTVVRNQKSRRTGRQVTGKVAKTAQDHQAEQMDVSDDDIIDLLTPINEMPPPSPPPPPAQEQPAMTVTTNNLPQMSLAAAATQKMMSSTTSTTTTTTTGQQISYKSRTLTTSNSERRHLILPAFPTSMENDHCPDLLLANVPDHLLSEQERNRRRSPTYRPPFHIVRTPSNNILVNTRIPSLFWPMYQEIFANVSEHLHVDMAIIDYNYARLLKCIDIWSKERIFRFRKTQHDVTLDQREYAIALEFYLQIDADLFYMKTCSFRNVQPHESQKHLFCLTDPVACHEMTACGNCGLCYPKYDVKKRRQPSVDFGLATRRHQFVNKYETILNCPCSCNTSNIIYVLTCPCGKFDYIGESGATLADRIEAHRFHGNRIMHETFLGPQNIKLGQPDHVKSAEILVKDAMYLYRHSTECQSAIQMFLDVNPRYWRFVPMTNEEVNQPEQSVLFSTVDVKFTDVQDENKIRLFIQNLPAPPANYRFSARQYHLQYAFFKSHRHLEMPNTHLDLYNAKIIAVLPETGSTVLRQIVESLFITHAETKLNSSGRLVGGNIDNGGGGGGCRNNSGNSNDADNNDNVSNRHQDVVWCEGLLRRPLTSVVEATAVAATTINGSVIKIET